MHDNVVALCCSPGEHFGSVSVVGVVTVVGEVVAVAVADVVVTSEHERHITGHNSCTVLPIIISLHCPRYLVVLHP